ncbi:MAG: hypothetical protein GC159_12015 [Phycisphaera sp.]|nr:hypothetical protein [Phycisphaera sp.]
MEHREPSKRVSVALAIGAVVALIVVAVLVVGFMGMKSKRDAMAAMNARELMIGVITYTTDNGGAFPVRIEQIEPYVGGPASLHDLMTNPRTGQYPGYEYIRPASDIASTPTATIVIHELDESGGHTGGVVARVDGSVVRTAPAGP